MTATISTATISTAALIPLAAIAYLRPAPPREPGFDDEVGGAQLAGPLDRRLPFASPRCHPTAHTASALPRTLPDPAGWAHRLLVGIIETAGGRRPLQQLSAMLSPAVAAGLAADFERAAQRNAAHWTHAATVRSMHATEPADGVAELSATVLAGRRVRAVALRLEACEGRWRCTRLQLG